MLQIVAAHPEGSPDQRNEPSCSGPFPDPHGLVPGANQVNSRPHYSIVDPLYPPVIPRQAPHYRKLGSRSVNLPVHASSSSVARLLLLGAD